VLAAGRELARAGFRIRLYRRPGRPLPRSVDGPWDWPIHQRTGRLEPCSPAALTITPAWGISAAPSRPGALGRGGAWEAEADDIERSYGAASTVHVSLEEFARTLTPAEEDRERLREGGVRARDLGRRLSSSRRSGERATLAAEFARFRAFDRPNVLHLFAGMAPHPAFRRRFPEAVETGPLWPRSFRPGRGPRRNEWVWYASPASAETIAPEVERGLAEIPHAPRLVIRTDRAWRGTVSPSRTQWIGGPVDARSWRRRFRTADLRIVTGSRTLLEALEVGGPFLYFNGALGEGTRRRRHRPEKLQELLRALRARGAPTDLVKDLADFGSGRRVGAVVARAARRAGGWSRFPRGIGPTGFPPPYADAGRLLTRAARALARAPRDARGVVARLRAGSPI
jgi:hypothetical protein